MGTDVEFLCGIHLGNSVPSVVNALAGMYDSASQGGIAEKCKHPAA